jgi:thymidylate synthase ThyX
MGYYGEPFTAEERSILARHFTNLDGPVFALVNLPEVIKGALFARYSRSAKSMRRLFLDEFVDAPGAALWLDGQGRAGERAVFDTDHATELFDRIFSEYGDDSVAQLGGAHVACEQASNILTKVLERGRLASYLEQSTRYIYFDKPLGGSYRYGLPPEIAAGSALATACRATMDQLFDTYKELVPPLAQHYGDLHPRPAGVAESVWKASVRARVCDDLRGLLPAATLSNVGIYASGQAFEALLLRMRAHGLQEVRDYGDLLLVELRKVIPSFLKRVDLPQRGARWSRYFAEIDASMRAAGAALDEPAPRRPEVLLVEWDAEAEVKLVAAALYAYCQLPDDRLLAMARAMTAAARNALIARYCGDRENRRHRPGRALERVCYRFDVLAPYSVFRDLQRHRLLTVEWQTLSTLHGYDLPEAVEEIGGGAIGKWQHAMGAAAELYEQVKRALGDSVAQYVVPFAFKIRFNWQVNAREACHILELRTQSGGDPAYRRICQEMHRLIREQAGHAAIADAMKFVDTGSYELGRLAGERRAAERRAALLEVPGRTNG